MASREGNTQIIQPVFTPDTSRLIAQRYKSAVFANGLRATCDFTSVINAARMIGVNTPDLQHRIVLDERLDWYTKDYWQRRRGRGGIWYGDLGESDGVEHIYQDYLPEEVALKSVGPRSWEWIAQQLAAGKALTVENPGRYHALTLAGLNIDRSQTQRLDRWRSILVDPDDGLPQELSFEQLSAHIAMVDINGPRVLIGFLVDRA